MRTERRTKMVNYEEINGIEYEERIFRQGVFLILKPLKGTPQVKITETIKELTKNYGKSFLGNTVIFK